MTTRIQKANDSMGCSYSIYHIVKASIIKLRDAFIDVNI